MERILCAAIHYPYHPKPPQSNRSAPSTGIVLCGWRHANIIGQYFVLTGKATRSSNSVQGFLTSTGRFVDRIEAGNIAIKAGQWRITEEDSGRPLYSEDLY